MLTSPMRTYFTLLQLFYYFHSSPVYTQAASHGCFTGGVKYINKHSSLLTTSVLNHLLNVYKLLMNAKWGFKFKCTVIT